MMFLTMRLKPVTRSKQLARRIASAATVYSFANTTGSALKPTAQGRPEQMHLDWRCPGP